MESVVEQDRALTTRQAAEVCGCSEVTIKRALAEDLPSFRIGVGDGRARRIWLSDLKAWTRARMESEKAGRAVAIGGAQ